MEQDTVCPQCGKDIPVIDSSIHGSQIVYVGLCDIDGEVEVTEW